MNHGESFGAFEEELLRIYHALPIKFQVLFMQRAFDFESEFAGK